MIINRNLLRNDSLATEKLCTVLFGKNRLKITMKRHSACCMRQYYTSNLCATKFETPGWRLHASRLYKETLQICSEKTFFIIEKIQLRNQVFVKLFPLSFPLSAFEVTFIKASYSTLCQQKELVYSLKMVHKRRSLISILFQPITARLFSIVAPFPVLSILMILLDKCKVKSFQNINILIKVKLLCLKNFFF